MSKQPFLKRNLPTIIFVSFLVYLGLMFYKFQYSVIDYFDKNNKLEEVHFSKNIESEIKDRLSLLNYNNTLIHLKDENCHCNRYSKEHIKDIDKNLSKINFNVINIDINKSELKEIIPAYPSTIMFDSKGELAYIGAYSDGVICSSDNSIVDLVLSNIKAGFNPKLINTDTKGCYCYT